MNPATGRATPGSISEMGRYILELQTKVRKDFTITISWLKAPVLCLKCETASRHFDTAGKGREGPLCGLFNDSSFKALLPAMCPGATSEMIQ